jgi:endonuclease/exonuclease/phosphatase family metal-dependent hydrolase
VIIAGDFNLDASKDAVARAFLTAGFQDAIAGPRTPTTPSRRLFEPGRQIDWAFIRGSIRAGSGQVHSRVKASDHYPISFTLTA